MVANDKIEMKFKYAYLVQNISVMQSSDSCLLINQLSRINEMQFDNIFMVNLYHK